ncbi:MAG: hypothetical protein ACPHO6_13680, partial [Candidatus Latescibacterota bacterium]
VPTGEYRNVDGLIPVGEGQWDFDLGLSAGRSLWPRAIYINADLGYRFRRANAAVDRDPGDEWFCSAEAGGRLASRLRMMGKFEMLRGDPAREFGGLANRSQIKRIRYASAVVYFDMDERTALEVGAYFAGRAQLSCGHAVDCCADSRLAHDRISQLMRIG